MTSTPQGGPTPFHDLQDFIALPRLGGLTLSPDGSRLVASVATLNPARTEYVNALWQIDPTGTEPAHRLTRGAKGERAPVFARNGDLLFVSARPDPNAAEPKDDAPTALWSLPANGGEARVIGSRAGGVDAAIVAADADTIVVSSKTLPASTTGEDDEQRRKQRKEREVTAILHAGHPVRYWDHDIGPAQSRLLAGTLPTGDDTIDWTDLTPTPGAALAEASAELSPDGRTVVTSWQVDEALGEHRTILVRIDVATGKRTTLLDDHEADLHGVRISPNGEHVAAIRVRRANPAQAPHPGLVLLPLAGGDVRSLAEDWDRWPNDLQWTPDGDALIVVADELGHAPLFRVDVTTGTVTRLTGDHGCYGDPNISPDSRHIYAMRNAVDSAPTPVRLDPTIPDQQPIPLRSPVETVALPGNATQISTTAQDGTELHSWLALPESDEPAPLVVWVHGGPVSSWNSWGWRWNPWLMVARGYAVLMPDPALSTGYGQDFVQRGWGAWGEAPYTDLMTLTDAVEQRSDVDSTRTAAMGGSFGGYMANWIAGHTDRFSAIVTHASLWALDSFGPTTDGAAFWRREITPEMAREHSPHYFADEIRTPMLVIHGDRDYRVPIGEALRLWWDLMSRQDDPAKQPHRFLYFPTENHWVLTPQHAIVWYETVLAFLGHHVLGEDFDPPEVLR